MKDKAKILTKSFLIQILTKVEKGLNLMYKYSLVDKFILDYDWLVVKIIINYV